MTDAEKNLQRVLEHVEQILEIRKKVFKFHLTHEKFEEISYVRGKMDGAQLLLDDIRVLAEGGEV